MSSWNDSLLIGVKLIDEQHIELISRMDQLVDACRHGKGHDEVGETLKFVVSYVNKHFKDEEELQELYAYPDMAAHKKLHAIFIENTIVLMQDLKTGLCDGFADRVKTMLIKWFLTHINMEDKKVGAYIHKVGGGKH